MIINKKTQKKLSMIARKMSGVGFGSVEELKKEVFERYLSQEMKKLI